MRYPPPTLGLFQMLLPKETLMHSLRLLLVSFSLAMLAPPVAAGQGVHLHDPWIREAPPGVQTLAGYMVVHNHGATPRVLVGASSPGFAKAMLHRSREANGIAQMVHVQRLEIGAGKSIAFAPGGYHIMLMKPKRRYRAGDEIPVTLRFANGEALTETFVVRKAR